MRGKHPGVSTEGSGLKINIKTGGVVCHYDCSRDVATHAVYTTDVEVNTQHVYEPEQKKKNQSTGRTPSTFLTRNTPSYTC